MKAMRKVWRYIKRYKKLLVVSVLAMLVVQFLGLLSPLIVKNILDKQLAGVENTWYEVMPENKTKDSVLLNDHYYQQEEVTDHPASIIVIAGKYYFVEDLVIGGNKKVENDLLTVTPLEGESVSYRYIVLNNVEVLAFYAPFIDELTVLLILLLVRFILQIVFTYIQRITTSMINVSIVSDARKDAVKALQRLPMSYLEGEPAGKTANRIISDVGGMMNLFSTIMNLLVNATLSIVFAYIGMFYLNAKLALMTFVLFPLVYMWLRSFIKKLNTIAVRVNEERSLITAQLNEIINGINILQIFNYRPETVKKFDNLSGSFMKEQVKEQKLHLSLGWNLIRLVGALVTAVIVLYFGYNQLTVFGFLVTAGIIYAYNDYLSRLIEPVGTLFREIGNLQHAIVKTERIFTLIDGEQEDDKVEALQRYEGAIRFDNVWFSYVKGQPVLKGIDLDIKAGSMVGIVGHTGSGKSTMMSLLLRFYDLNYDYDMGHIYIDEVDINTHSKRSYRKDIGIILQDPVIFKGTVAENIRFGSEASEEDIVKVLHEIGGSALLSKLSEGINTMLARGGSNLSLGEKQLISFARAVVHNPAVLIMDEATANIDTETETMIQTALKKVKSGRTMIVIAHRLSTIKHADKIVVLENGIKVEEGKHTELLAQDGVYANIYRSQIKARI